MKRAYYLIIDKTTGAIEVTDYITYDDGTYLQALEYLDEIKDDLLKQAQEEITDTELEIVITYNLNGEKNEQ